MSDLSIVEVRRAFIAHRMANGIRSARATLKAATTADRPENVPPENRRSAILALLKGIKDLTGTPEARWPQVISALVDGIADADGALLSDAENRELKFGALIDRVWAKRRSQRMTDDET